MRCRKARWYLSARCDDTLFCTLNDVCDTADEDADAAGCVNDGDPCECTGGGTPCDIVDGDRQLCNEADDVCDDCTGNAACDDGIACTDDTCDGGSGTCTSTNNDANCDDGQFCTSSDVCDPSNVDAGADGCVNDTDPCPPKLCNEVDNTCDDCTANDDCDDGVDCTDDTCNGAIGDCVFTDNCTVVGETCGGGGDPNACG